MSSGAITIRKRGREVLVTEYLERVAGHGGTVTEQCNHSGVLLMMPVAETGKTV